MIRFRQVEVYPDSFPRNSSRFHSIPTKRTGHPVSKWCAVFVVACAAALHAGEPTPPPPLAPSADRGDRFDFSYETAVAFGVNNPNHYVTNPELLSLRWQPKPTEQFFHTPFTFAHQFGVGAVIVPFLHGPEHHYFALGVSTRLIYGKSGSRFSIYVDGMFAVGAIDSSGPPHGQGEDLTFSALVSGGLQYQATPRQRVSLGLLYEHFSNGGLSEPEEPNIGLNTLGPKLEWHIAF